MDQTGDSMPDNPLACVLFVINIQGAVRHNSGLSGGIGSLVVIAGFEIQVHAVPA